MINKKTKIVATFFFLCVFCLPAMSQAGYDFYVDKNSLSLTEDGTAFAPWKTISAALSHIESNGWKQKKVYIKNGTYQESIEVRNNTKLIGESKGATVIDSEGKNNGINFVSTKSELKNITVKNADATGIIIDKRSKVDISNCSIEGSGNFGIEVKESSNTQKYKFSIANSAVSGSGSQGLYISKRKINISDNEVFSNNEEGVDLHRGVKGTVADNHIHGNSESGIESILGEASLNIKNNHVENNHTQGITVQVYSTSHGGSAKISGNTITGSKHYGVRFANYTNSVGSKKFKAFIDKHVKLSKNTLRDNDDGNYYYE